MCVWVKLGFLYVKIHFISLFRIFGSLAAKCSPMLIPMAADMLLGIYGYKFSLLKDKDRTFFQWSH